MDYFSTSLCVTSDELGIADGPVHRLYEAVREPSE